MADLPAKGLLLDVGGGTGRKSYPLMKMVDGIVIADSSMGMLHQARKKDGLVVIFSEAERLPFAEESFERIIMVDAFHHVRDHRLTATEMWRVLKAGGRIVIEEPDIGTSSVKVMAMIEKIALMRSHFITARGIAACFTYAGAKVHVEVESTTAWIIVEKQAE